MALMRHPWLFRGLYMAPALTGLGFMITLSDKQQAEKYGMGLREYRDRTAELLLTKPGMIVSNILLSTSSPSPSIQVEGSSSHDLVQNGGPPALMLPSGSPSSEANGSATSSAGGDSAHGRSSAGVRGRRRHRCPKGHRWNGRRCVPIRKR